MIIETVPLDSIQLDPANVRTHSERNIDAIVASLHRFGQVKPIVIDATGVVRAGNGTLIAARRLGWPTIQVVRSTLQGAELIAYAISDNRVGDPEVGSLWDTHALTATLDSLNNEDSSLAEVTGFSLEELSMLMAGQGKIDALPADAAGHEVDESAADKLHTIICPHCGKVVPL